MTSASELFNSRRTRLGRSSSEFESDSTPDQISIHRQISGRRHHRLLRSGNGTHRVGRLDLIGCDPPPRSRIIIHRSPVHEHENLNSSENDVHIRDRFTIIGNDGLPGPVLLARERLLQRLRGVSLSGSRRSTRVSTSTDRTDRINLTIEDGFRLAAAREQVARTDMATFFLRRDKMKRPPGLTQESLESLQVEIFNNMDNNTIEEAIPQECSICLEAFLNGDELFCLPCGHRFHNGCLVPWVRTCGDCPYCRAHIS